MGLDRLVENEEKKAKVELGNQTTIDESVEGNIKLFLRREIRKRQRQEEIEPTDATDSVEVFENGKTWECVCGQGIGTHKEARKVRCYSCYRQLEDKKAQERAEEDASSREGDSSNDTEDDGQFDLGDFF